MVVGVSRKDASIGASFGDESEASLGELYKDDAIHRHCIEESLWVYAERTAVGHSKLSSETLDVEL